MISTKTAEASRLYKAGAFAEALALYQELSRRIGRKFFHANIALCERRLNLNRPQATAPRESISTVFITDETYLMPTYVAIHSLVKNRDPDRVYDIYVVLSDVETSAHALLKGLGTTNVNIHIRPSDINFSRYRITKKDFHVSPTAILKFELPGILPHLDKVLYLDGDILINSGLTELFDVDVTGEYAAVVEDIKPKLKYQPSILKKLNISRHRGYFNSGVMLLNLAAMRRDDITRRLFDYRENGLNFFMDQDALNVVFGDEVKYLSWKSNLLVTLEPEFSLAEIAKEYGERDHYESFAEMVASSHITHFASKYKPWKGVQSGHAHLWNGYYLSSGAHCANFKVGHEIRATDPRQKIVVSLTSYPARIQSVKHTIESLLSQDYKPASVVLWLAVEQFPAGERDLPADLLALRSRGLAIEWCKDIKSFKKLIPALKRFPDSVIVTADDDIIYNQDWLSRLVASYLQSPEVIHCFRAHKVLTLEDGSIASYRKWPREISASDAAFDVFFTGCGGVLYPPNCLDPRVFDEAVFSEVCPSGDDIWFWGMALLNGTKVKVVGDGKFHLNFVENSQDVALWKENDVGGRNDAMMSNLMKRFPAIMQKLKVRELAMA